MLPVLKLVCSSQGALSGLRVCRGLDVPVRPYFCDRQRSRPQRCWAEPVRRGNGERDPLAETCPVPSEQQPVKELQALQEVFAFNWATLPLPQLLTRLGIVWGGFFATMGLPVSAVTFNPQDQPIAFFASAGLGSLCVVTVVVLRLYLGWSHVGNRLLSATCEYEESGWYDGQVWVKPPQYLARDRLLGTYTVRPALARLRTTLLGLAGVAVVLTAALATPQQAGAGLSARGGARPAADDSSSSSQPLQPQPEYWDLVRRFEPWALEDPDLPDEVRQGRPAVVKPGDTPGERPHSHFFHPDLPVISYQ